MKTIKVTCALIEHNGKILITQRSESMSHPLQWEFPGGKVELCETEEECLIREIKEELNLEIEIVSQLRTVEHTYPEKNIILIPFVCKVKQGSLVLLEHARAEWVSLLELEKYDWVEADVEVVKQYLLYKQIS